MGGPGGRSSGPFGVAGVEPASLEPAGPQEADGVVGVDAVGAAAVGDDLAATGECVECVVELVFSEKALSSASQAGLVNNLNDELAWGLLPLYFAAVGVSVARIDILVALYPAVWGLGQLVTGGLSDRIGRRPLIASGMIVQAAALGLIAATEGFTIWAVGAVLLGVGTAMVYPTLLAAIGDVAHPSWRARSVGIYRLWRDGGFAVGALLAGALAEAFDISVAIWPIAALTATSGIVVMVRMYETHPRHDRAPVPDDADLES